MEAVHTDIQLNFDIIAARPFIYWSILNEKRESEIFPELKKPQVNDCIDQYLASNKRYLQILTTY